MNKFINIFNYIAYILSTIVVVYYLISRTYEGYSTSNTLLITMFGLLSMINIASFFYTLYVSDKYIIPSWIINILFIIYLIYMKKI